MRVPADMSVVTICPEDEATSLVPPISGVTLPVAELGKLAVDQLMGILHGEVPHPVLLRPALTPRGSAGPPPRSPVLGEGEQRRSASEARSSVPLAPGLSVLRFRRLG
jgi:hypothetical protein